MDTPLHPSHPSSRIATPAKTLKAPLLSAALLALLALTPGLAGAADLLQYYRDALANDAQFASARASLVAGAEKLPQGRAGLLPTLGLTANSLFNRVGVDNNDPYPNIGKRYNSSGYTLALTQPLFRWSNWQAYEQGKLAVAVAEAQFAQAQQDLMLRVAQAYFDVLAADDNITYIVAQKAAITEQLASAKRNFEVGTATITDTNEAQARYDLAVAQELSARNDLDIKRTNLQQIIGKAPGALTPLRPGVALTSPDPKQIEPWVDSAEKVNYSVVQQSANLEIAKRQVEVSRSGHYPTLDLVANRTLARTPVTVPVIATTSNSVGVQLSVPLYAGGLVQSKVRESLALQDKAENDLEFTRRSAAQSARQAFFGVNSGLAQVKALEAAEVSSQSALDSNKLGYQVGVRINIDVLNAQQQLFSTRKDLAKARYDTLVNGLKLKSAAGTLKEEDLVQVNGLLQQ